MNKILFILMLISIMGCSDNNSIRVKMLSVIYCKSAADPVFGKQIDDTVATGNNSNKYNYMYIEIAYSIKNISKAPLYIPFKTWSDDSTFSSMSVFLINGKDTIVPLYRIKKCPYNSDLVNVGDSMLLWIKLYGFNRWQNKDYNINTNVQDIVKAIKLIYNRDARDKKMPHKTPALIFDSVPINNRYFERPSSSGEEIL